MGAETLIAGIHHSVGMGLAKEIPGWVSGLNDATIRKHSKREVPRESLLLLFLRCLLDQLAKLRILEPNRLRR